MIRLFKELRLQMVLVAVCFHLLGCTGTQMHNLPVSETKEEKASEGFRTKVKIREVKSDPNPMQYDRPCRIDILLELAPGITEENLRQQYKSIWFSGHGNTRISSIPRIELLSSEQGLVRMILKMNQRRPSQRFGNIAYNSVLIGWNDGSSTSHPCDIWAW